MKRTVPTAVSLTFLLALSCSDNSPTGSDNPPSQALSTVTIGPAGGQLAIADFALTVPAGAFDASATLELYADSSDGPLADHDVTTTYLVEGLPETFAQPLSIRIRYNGLLDSTSYIAAGGTWFNPTTNAYQPAFRMFEAADSAGFLVIVLPAASGYSFASPSPAPKTGETTQGPLAAYFVGQTGYDKPIITPHFQIVFASNLNLDPKVILPTVLENALDTLVKAGFTLAKVPMPIEVYAVVFPQIDEYRYCTFFPAWGALTLVLDQSKITNLTTYGQFLKGAITRECAHAVLCTYDNQYFDVLLHRQAKYNVARFWLHHAVASWFEEKMVGLYVHDEIFTPLDFDRTHDNRQQPFEGIQAGSGSTLLSSRNHGGGMSSLMKYLALNYNQSVFWRIYTDIDQNHSHPVTAIRNSVADEADVWWADFLKEYIRDGDIYGGPWSSDLYAGDLHGTFTIATEADSMASFSYSYPDLSARAYLIELDANDIDSIAFTTSSATVTPDDRRILVFGFKGGISDRFLAEGLDQVTIHDVGALKADGVSQLWAAVVNGNYDEATYTGTGNIQLNIKAWFKNVPDYNRCLPWYEVIGSFTSITGDPPDTTEYDHGAWPNWEPVRGSFVGNSFIAEWDTVTYDGDPYTGSMTITFNSTFNQVVSYSVEASVSRSFGITDHITFRGSGLPLTGEMGATARYRVDGTAACSHISTLTDTTLNTGGTMSVTLDSFTCQSDGWVEVYFYRVD